MQSELTEAQIEAVLNFQAVTENYDQERALELLNRNSWDVMAAAQDYYAQISFESHRPVQRREEPRQSVEELIDMSRPSRVQIDEEPAESPGMFSSVWSGIKYISSSLSSFTSGLLSGFTTTTSTSATSFIKQITAAYPDLTFPNFSNLSLNEILTQARETRRPLIFYIHSSKVSDRFVREVLCSDVIVDILNQNFLIWGSLDTSQEGRGLVKNLRTRETPAFAVCRVVDANPILLETTEGQLSMEGMFTFLDNNLMLFREQTASVPSSTPSQRYTDPKLEQDRLIRQEQEQAYKEMEQQYLEQQRAKQVEEERTRREEEATKLAKDKIELHRSQMIQDIGPEPEAGANVAELVIRFPNGSKSSRRFWKDATLAKLFAYVDTLDLNLTKPYEIVWSYPLTRLQPTEDTLESAGLHPKAIVHVREHLTSD